MMDHGFFDGPWGGLSGGRRNFDLLREIAATAQAIAAGTQRAETSETSAPSEGCQSVLSTNASPKSGCGANGSGSTPRSKKRSRTARGLQNSHGVKKWLHWLAEQEEYAGPLFGEAA